LLREREREREREGNTLLWASWCCCVQQGLFSCPNQGKVEVAGGGGVPCGGAGRRGLTKMDTKLLEYMRKL